MHFLVTLYMHIRKAEAAAAAAAVATAESNVNPAAFYQCVVVIFIVRAIVTVLYCHCRSQRYDCVHHLIVGSFRQPFPESANKGSLLEFNEFSCTYIHANGHRNTTKQ